MLAVAIIVVAAKGSGYLSNRLGQPAVLGEMLAGLVLGPTVLDMLHWPLLADPHLGETLSHLAHLGVLFLMFIAGLEVDLEGMVAAGRPAALGGVLGVAVPLALGAATALLFGFDGQQAVFIGLVLSATSVSISAQTLMELGVLRSRVGIVLLSAAVVDDVLVILALSLFTAASLAGGGGLSALVWLVARMGLFFAAAYWLGRRLIPRLARFVDRLPISEGLIALVVVITLLYAVAAEVLGGVAAITGAFLAGLVFAPTPLRGHIEARMHTMAYAWLVPIFFVSIGLETDLRALGRDYLPFTAVIVVVAVLAKIAGSGAGARLGGLSGRDALRVGVGMISRGEVGLIVATVGLDADLIRPELFAAVVLVVLVTTLLTPVLLKMQYPQERSRPAEAAAA